MRITKIRVRELFGLPTFNYDIQLKTDERITIIHGPNGSGKTVLFKMIDGLFHGQYNVFFRYPFTEFAVAFDNGEELTVTRKDGKNDRMFPSVKMTHSAKPSDPFKLDPNEYLTTAMSGLSHKRLREIESAEFARVMWRFERNFLEDRLNADDLMCVLRDEIPPGLFVETKWMPDLQKRLKISFISTRRLSTTKPSPGKGQGVRTVPAISEDSADLSSQIKQSSLEADTEAKTLDRTFPHRVVNNALRYRSKSLTYEDIRTELEQLEKKRKRLTEAGFPGLREEENEFQIPAQITGSQRDSTLRSVLTLYIEDSKRKLEVHEDLVNRIEVFRDIIQGMLRNKQLSISSERGFQLKSDYGQIIPLDELSSGEQHLLVVMYNLLFSPQRNTDELILIDEPEISLHISWQKRFVDDLLRISKLSNFDVIIATHSPAIINGRLDLMVGIQGATGQED